MIDTHAHLNCKDFTEDLFDVIENSKKAGVESIIIPACENKDFEEIDRLTKIDFIYAAYGIHPHTAIEYNQETEDRIINFSKSNKAVAIGEIGLDYYYDFAPKELQKDVFSKQVKLAKKLARPIIVHNRESDSDLLSILEKEQDGTLNGALHCFSSDLQMLKNSLSLGLYISFTGNITFKKSNLEQIVANTPDDRIMLETDSPYMTPVPFRGKRNDSTYLKYVAQKIADIKNLSIERVIDMTNANARKLFHLALVLLFILSSQFTWAQKTESWGDDRYNPYQKKLGFGIFAGSSVIVSNETTTDSTTGKETTSPISGNTAFAMGLSVVYPANDYILFSLSYLYSKQKTTYKPVDVTFTDYNIHQAIEASANFIANPYARVNFYGILGYSLFNNVYNTNEVFVKKSSDSKNGVNFGVGFIVNIPTKFGLITPMAEWKLNWLLGSSNVSKIENGVTYNTKVTNFFSTPRLSVVWYPNL